MATARHFDETKYDGSYPYGGVPLADISDDEWKRLPRHVQESTDALPYYRKTPIRSTTTQSQIETDGPAHESSSGSQ